MNVQHTGHTRVHGNFGQVGGTLVLDNGSPQRRVPLEPQDKLLKLYDLNNDIAEEHNIAADHPNIIAKTKDYLKTARTDSPNWPV